MLNLVATGLYTGSLYGRLKRKRDAGRVLAYSGFIVSTAAAYLGGNLVYGKQIGAQPCHRAAGAARLA